MSKTNTPVVESTEETAKTWFTKTIARETLSAVTAELLAAGELTKEVKDQLDNLFAGRIVASNTLVRDEEGVVVLKRCSYFGVYLPVSEFGTVGKDEQGLPKLAYMSKAGAAAQRASKSELDKAITEANAQLEVDEDVAAWKQAKIDAVAASEVRGEYDGEVIAYATYEDACEAVANGEVIA